MLKSASVSTGTIKRHHLHLHLHQTSSHSCWFQFPGLNWTLILFFFSFPQNVNSRGYLCLGEEFKLRVWSEMMWKHWCVRSFIMGATKSGGTRIKELGLWQPNHPILVTPGLSQTRPDTIGITINQANKDCLYKVQIPNPKYREASDGHQTTDIYQKCCAMFLYSALVT